MQHVSQPSLITRLPFRVCQPSALLSHALYICPSLLQIYLIFLQSPLFHVQQSINPRIAMKQTSIAAAFLAVGATAQNSTLTRTEYYNTCSITAGGIVTATDIQTYCPPCEAAGMTTFPGGSLTTYTTIYSQVCPTGLEEATYTVTEPCPSTGLARGSSYIPQGFTVTTVPCSVCEAGKSSYPQTTPGPALASALAAPPAAPAIPTSGAGAGKAAPPSVSTPAAASGAPGAGAPSAPAAAGAASPANAENAAAAPVAAAPAASAETGDAVPSENGAASPAENGAASPAENGAAAPAENGAAAPAENGAAAPAGSPAGAPAPYPLPSQAGQVGAATGAPASNGNSTVPFKGAANIIPAVDISSFITALATLMTGFAFVL